MSRYSLTEEQKKEYAGTFLLEHMINKPEAFDLLLDKGDQDLESILEWLMVRDYVEIHEKEKYVPTEKGRECISRFLARYSEFLTIFDIYCAVDLAEGEFAFSSYFDYPDKTNWQNYLAGERWEDLRIAVAEFKKVNPVEIVFMSYIAENRFGKDETGWQFDLLLGSIWDEILEICESALHIKDLGYEDEDGPVNGRDVLKDVMEQATELMMSLLKREAELAPLTLHDDAGDDDGYVETVVIESYGYDYYDPYYDPYYISPLWLGLWLI